VTCKRTTNTYVFGQRRARDGTGSPGHRVSDFGRVGSWVSVSDPVFDPVLSFNMRVYRGVVSTDYRVTASRQANIRGLGFGSVPVTALLVYLFQLVPVNV